MKKRVKDIVLGVPITLSVVYMLGAGSQKPPVVRKGIITSSAPSVSKNTITSLWDNVTTPLLAGANHDNHRGSAWCDYDNDGFLDLYLSHFGLFTDGQFLGSQNQLLKNIDGSEFVEVTTEAIGVGSELSHHSAWADIDNDGLPDLFVGQSTNYGTDINHLVQQNAAGEFTDITNGDPLAMYWLLPRGVSWQDTNNDGFVDLFVAISGGDNLRNRLMLNQGDNTFELDVSCGLLGSYRQGRGVAWSDYNNDGLCDVYVVNGAEDNSSVFSRTNSLFKNNGDGTWSDVAVAAGVNDIGHGRGVAWGDINNDGHMDIIVGNQVGSDYPGYNILYVNNGDGTFTDISDSAGIVENVRTRCVSMADYDNDGFLDLYTVSFGSVGPPNRLYHNNGDLTFDEVAANTPAEAPFNGDSASWTDYDNDGWVDLYTVGGSVNEFAGVGQNQLLRNVNQNGNHWIEFVLCGNVSNRSAIGARISITHRNAAQNAVYQMREVQSGSGYNAQNMMRVHFGLGASDIVDEVTIQWPSGIIQSTSGLQVDQLLRVVEDEVFAYDCNRNCVDDSVDIVQGFSLDVNANDIPDECECLADFDGNGNVNIHDLLNLISQWGATSTPKDPLQEDLDGDGTVDVTDLMIVISQFGDC
jgi:hypothetical protein